MGSLRNSLVSERWQSNQKIPHITKKRQTKPKKNFFIGTGCFFQCLLCHFSLGGTTSCTRTRSQALYGSWLFTGMQQYSSLSSVYSWLTSRLSLMLPVPMSRATHLCSATLIGLTGIWHPDYFFQGSMADTLHSRDQTVPRVTGCTENWVHRIQDIDFFVNYLYYFINSFTAPALHLLTRYCALSSTCS